MHHKLKNEWIAIFPFFFLWLLYFQVVKLICLFNIYLSLNKALCQALKCKVQWALVSALKKLTCSVVKIIKN